MTENGQTNPFTPPQAAVEDSRQSGEDSSFRLNLFSAQGRIGRVRYIAYSFGLSFLAVIVGAIVAALVGFWFFALVYVFLVYMQFMITIKRCHDFDSTGWLSLLVLVPFANMAFLFIPGTDGPNRFGNKTAPNGKAAVVAILLAVAVPLIGILAAIAIPQYQQYVERAKAVQVQQQEP